MNTLLLHDVKNIEELETPEHYVDLDTNSSALKVITDFQVVKPRVIESNTRAVDTETLMLKTHVKLNIVIDQHDKFVGLVTLANISNENLLRFISAGTNRNDILVADIMTPKAALKACDYADLEHANIGQVLNTLQQSGLQHCLIVDHQKNRIRGLISATDIAKKLNIPLSMEKPPSFSDLYLAISESHKKHAEVHSVH